MVSRAFQNRIRPPGHDSSAAGCPSGEIRKLNNQLAGVMECACVSVADEKNQQAVKLVSSSEED
jgi:hypothetical protein